MWYYLLVQPKWCKSFRRLLKVSESLRKVSESLQKVSESFQFKIYYLISSKKYEWKNCWDDENILYLNVWKFTQIHENVRKIVNLVMTLLRVLAYVTPNVAVMVFTQWEICTYWHSGGLINVSGSLPLNRQSKIRAVLLHPSNRRETCITEVIEITDQGQECMFDKTSCIEW